ncbi:MAG: ribonuclease HII [Methanomassiliicoccaceae archaeon]|jgi:ribonuclease HII|nr:ribonuclease HII [Methanomassiliicoccaceae archaeon]
MICGIDEAGRGPVMGPMVVAAVLVEDDAPLIGIGVKDSKKLSPATRERMFGEITEVIAEHRIIIISAEEIDSRRKNCSLNEIELQMFADSAQGMNASVIYADCPDANELSFSSSLSAKLGGIRVAAEHKADDTYPAVSAASILAKVTRDRCIDAIAKEFGTDIGSGYPGDAVTIDFIGRWIKENGNAPPHTRCSWETVRKMMTVSMNRKITDW